MHLLDVNYLLASLVWSSVGFGYFIYGKKQQSIIPLIGGLLMVTISFMVGSALGMSVLCAATMVAVYLLVRQGY